MDTNLLNTIMARRSLSANDLASMRSEAARFSASKSARAVGEFVAALNTRALRQAKDVEDEANILGQAATEALTRITAERTENRELKVVLDLHHVLDEDADIFDKTTVGVLMVEGIKAGTQQPTNPLTIRSVQAIVCAMVTTGEDATPLAPTDVADGMMAVADALKRTQLRLKVTGSDDLLIPLGAMLCGDVFCSLTSITASVLGYHAQLAQSIAHPIQGLDLVSADDALSATLNDPREVGALGICHGYMGAPPKTLYKMWGTLTILFNCEAI